MTPNPRIEAMKLVESQGFQPAELIWEDKDSEGGAAYHEAVLGDFYGKKGEPDGVRFYWVFQATCYRRGQHLLLIDICGGTNHIKWGCFDAQDQPTRYYHRPEALIMEAQALATVLWKDRVKA